MIFKKKASSSWYGKTQEDNYKIEITKNVFSDLNEFSSKRDLLTGGVLVGKYSEDLFTAIITEVLPAPLDSFGGIDWFRRGISGLEDILIQRWNNKNRTFYLGEWFYIPSDFIEFKDNFFNTREISEDEKYSCKSPILLLVGKPSSNNGYQQPFRSFVYSSFNSKMLEFY